jgi:hypothetical protein
VKEGLDVTDATLQQASTHAGTLSPTQNPHPLQIIHPAIQSSGGKLQLFQTQAPVHYKSSSHPSTGGKLQLFQVLLLDEEPNPDYVVNQAIHPCIHWRKAPSVPDSSTG